MTLHVAIRASDSALRKALSSRLSAWPGLAIEDSDGPSSATVLVAPARDFPPAECMRFVARGGAVVVLATVWRAAEEAAYLAAGASSYLAMDLDLPALARAVQAAGASLATLPKP